MSEHRTEALLKTINASLDELARLKSERTELREALISCCAVLSGQHLTKQALANALTESRAILKRTEKP